MKLSFFISTLVLYNLSFGQVKEHKCPDNSTFRKERVGNEIICECIHDTLLNGLTIIYSDNGLKKEENNWDMGVKSGKWKEWNEKGILIYEATYKNGEKDGEEIFYFGDGKPKVLTTFKNGIKNGRIAEWFKTGKQNTEGYFTNDTQDKIWIFRMPGNKTVSVAKYINGTEQKYKFVKWTQDSFNVIDLEKALEQ